MTCSVAASADGVSGTVSVYLRTPPASVPDADSGSLAANDDCSTGLLNIGMRLDFYGTKFSQVYVNNNGNLTLGSAMSTYTPGSPLTTAYGAIIAPFFAMWTLATITALSLMVRPPLTIGRVGGGLDRRGVLRGARRLAQHVQRDAGRPLRRLRGDFDIVFDYGSIAWETGNVSGGYQGLEGTSARPATPTATARPGPL